MADFLLQEDDVSKILQENSDGILLDLRPPRFYSRGFPTTEMRDHPVPNARAFPLD